MILLKYSEVNHVAKDNSYVSELEYESLSISSVNLIKLETSEED